MDLTIETITPSHAAKLLESNTDNRKIRRRSVDAYARDMRNNNWIFNGAPIILNGTVLLDGQHRLLACVEADTPFQTAVLRNADAGVHPTIDTGMKRSFADELRWRGEGDPNSLAAVATTIWRIDRNMPVPRGGGGQTRPTTAELVQLLDDNPGIRDSLTPARRAKREINAPKTPFAALWYLISREHGVEVADDFTEGVCSGAELQAEDAILALRRYIAQSYTRRRPYPDEWLAILIKAFNYWYEGRPVKHLVWRGVGRKAQEFPQLVRADEQVE